MRVAAWQLPEVRNDPARALSSVKAHALEAQQRGADLVCFPECYLQGYDVRPEHAADGALDFASAEFHRVLEELEAIEAVIVVGLIERDAGSFYNSAVAIERGKLVARYRKTHLLQGERSVFCAGDGTPVFEVAGVRVGIHICYDLCFAESVGRAVELGAQILVCPCSNMLPRAAAEAWKPRHNEIRARHAREHRVWIVSSDVTGERDGWVSYGPTAVIDPSGAVVEQVPLSQPGMVIAQIR